MKNEKPTYEELERRLAIAESVNKSMDSLLNSTETLIALLGDDGTVLMCNSAMAESLGSTIKEITGNIVWSYIDSETVNRRQLYLQECLEKNEIVNFEDKRDGRHFFTSFAPVDVNRALVTVQNVTERKLALEAQRESEEKWRSLVENVPNIILIVDRDSTIRFINRTVSGITVEKATGTNIYDYIEPEYHEAIRVIIEQVFQTGEPGSYENRGVGPDGLTSWYETQVGPIKRDGQIVAVTLIATDTTERRRADEALLESKQRLELALRGADLGLWDWNVQTGGVVFDLRWAEMLGYSLEEIEPHIRTWEKLVHPDDMPGVEEVLNTHLEGKSPFYESEHRLLTKSGEWKWVLDRGRVLEWDKDCKPLRAVGTHLDITERKRAEEEKEKIQAQFLQAQKMEAIGQLAGGMAHDFNNMLTVIMGNANLALMGMKRDDPNRFEFKEIMNASDRSKDLTMKLLTFARKEKINVRPTRISTVINELTGMLDRSIIKKIEIKSILKDEVTLNIDTGQIQQALLNVCTNACYAMQDGGKLLIEARKTVLDEDFCKKHTGIKPGHYCLIQVSDTGFGIPEEMIQKVFEPFFTTKDSGKGTGLGLSTTLGIVQNHDGHIRIYSEPGYGTTVKIHLPIAEGVEAGNEPAAQDEIRRGTETILVVDDEKHVLKIVKRVLEGVGYTTITADGGKKAIELFKKHHKKIELVILDMIMPEMDGRDVFFAIKEINPDVKIVMSSGYSINGHAGNLIKEGIHGFVQKPFTILDLCNTVRKVLDE